MNGLSTGNTLYDALILLVPIALAFVAQRFGITGLLVWLGEQLVRLKPTPQPEEPKPVEPPVAPVNGQVLMATNQLPGKPVALEWIVLFQTLLPIILQIVEMFRQRTGRMPTRSEWSAIQSRVETAYLHGEPLDQITVDEFVPVEMPVVK